MPFSPPVTNTVPSFNSVAVWKYRPVARLPVTVKLGTESLRPNSSALDREPPEPKPPQMKTRAFCSNVAVCVVRAVFNVAKTPVKAGGVNEPVTLRKPPLFDAVLKDHVFGSESITVYVPGPRYKLNVAIQATLGVPTTLALVYPSARYRPKPCPLPPGRLRVPAVRRFPL